MADREQELRDIPLRPADKSTWPEGVRTVSSDEQDALGVDARGACRALIGYGNVGRCGSSQ